MKQLYTKVQNFHFVIKKRKKKKKKKERKTGVSFLWPAMETHSSTRVCGCIVLVSCDTLFAALVRMDWKGRTSLVRRLYLYEGLVIDSLRHDLCKLVVKISQFTTEKDRRGRRLASTRELCGLCDLVRVFFRTDEF